MDQNIEREDSSSVPSADAIPMNTISFRPLEETLQRFLMYRIKSLLRSAAHAADLPSYIRARLQRA